MFKFFSQMKRQRNWFRDLQGKEEGNYLHEKWGSTIVEFANKYKQKDDKKDKILDKLTKLTSLKLYGITSIY